MKWNPEPGAADPREAREFFIAVALEGTNPPPREFIEAVMIGKLELPSIIMEKLVDRGWLPRTRCEIWSRVMGYFRPVSSWNVGKKSEFNDRTRLKPEKLLL